MSEMRPICGYAPADSFGTVCVNDPDHDGEHRLVSNSPASLRAEGVLTDITPISGSELTKDDRLALMDVLLAAIRDADEANVPPLEALYAKIEVPESERWPVPDDRTAPADPREALAPDNAALKLLVGKTPGQADWLRPVTVADVEKRLAARQDEPSPALRLALDALEEEAHREPEAPGEGKWMAGIDYALSAIRAALAANPPQTREVDIEPSPMLCGVGGGRDATDERREATVEPEQPADEAQRDAPPVRMGRIEKRPRLDLTGYGEPAGQRDAGNRGIDPLRLARLIKLVTYGGGETLGNAWEDSREIAERYVAGEDWPLRATQPPVAGTEGGEPNTRKEDNEP